MFAQALIEKGALDGVIAGVMTSLGNLGQTVQNRPWLWLVLAVGLMLLVRRGRT